LGAAACFIAIGLIESAQAARGDEFSQLEGPLFFELVGRADAHAHSSLTVPELDRLPVVLRDERTAFVIVRTDQGNLTKLLVSSGLRRLKPSEKEGPLVPVLVLERFETIDAADRRSLKARGKELTLFDGFRFDLDAGQVVPEGLGGDVVFLSNVPAGPRLAALNESRLFTLEKPLPALATNPGKPSLGKAVVPGDFGGRFNLVANGQWSGTLSLAIDGARSVTGHFRSDRNGSAYPVTGTVSAEIPQRIDFSIQFPRARQLYEGYLWSEGKNAIAGSVSMLDHPYGFIAVREGTSLGAEIDLASAPPLSAKVSRSVVIVEAGSDRFTFDGVSRTQAELTEALAKAVKKGPATEVLLRVGDTVPFERVRRAAEAVRAVGVTSVRILSATEAGDPG
jgi:biopolymer transport protein ExbD